MKKNLPIILFFIIGTLFAKENHSWEATDAKNKKTFTIENMLAYAIEDEYSAKTEYNLIIKNLDKSNLLLILLKLKTSILSG